MQFFKIYSSRKAGVQEYSELYIQNNINIKYRTAKCLGFSNNSP